jgi:hypothetical protein
MIAHRGSYNLDLITENSKSNCLHFIQNFNYPLEIDLFFFNNNFYLGHDYDKAINNYLNFFDFINYLNYNNEIYLDLKTDNNPNLNLFVLKLFSLLNNLSFLKINIHSNNLDLMKLIYNSNLNKYNLGFLIENNFLDNYNVFNYYVLDKQNINIIKIENKPVYWFTFKNNLEWFLFKNQNNLDNSHKGFIDYFF